jgi:DNA polymerase-3 subunit epsilon
MKMLAFVSVKTSGADPKKHEIVEMALVRVSPVDLEPLSEVTFKVKLEHPERADKKMLKLAGYDVHEWSDAVPLKHALDQFSTLLEDTILAGHDVAFDRRFLEAAWEKTGVRPVRLGMHAIDTMELARPLFLMGRVPTLSLRALARSLEEELTTLGLDALGDAHRAVGILRNIVGDGLLDEESSELDDVLGSGGPDHDPDEDDEDEDDMDEAS